MMRELKQVSGWGLGALLVAIVLATSGANAAAPVVVAGDQLIHAAVAGEHSLDSSFGQRWPAAVVDAQPGTVRLIGMKQRGRSGVGELGLGRVQLPYRDR